MTKNIIVDTDPGVDDALALIYLSATNEPINGITTVYGNSTIEYVTNNALYITSLLGQDWPVFKGADKPINGTGRLAQSHGDTGLGNVSYDNATLPLMQPAEAKDYLISTLDTNIKTTILCLGPLTNLAIALESIDDVHGKIDEVIIMGGAFSQKGNVTEYAEFNFYNDPYAVQQTLKQLSRNKIKTTIIPAEVCREVVLLREELDTLKDEGYFEGIENIVGPYLEHYINDASDGEHLGAVLYDVLVPIYMQSPELFECIGAKITINDDENGERYGQSLMSEDQNSTIQVARSVNAQAVKAIFMKQLLR